MWPGGGLAVLSLGRISTSSLVGQTFVFEASSLQASTVKAASPLTLHRDIARLQPHCYTLITTEVNLKTYFVLRGNDINANHITEIINI